MGSEAIVSIPNFGWRRRGPAGPWGWALGILSRWGWGPGPHKCARWFGWLWVPVVVLDGWFFLAHLGKPNNIEIVKQTTFKYLNKRVRKQIQTNNIEIFDRPFGQRTLNRSTHHKSSVGLKQKIITNAFWMLNMFWPEAFRFSILRFVGNRYATSPMTMMCQTWNTL